MCIDSAQSRQELNFRDSFIFFIFFSGQMDYNYVDISWVGLLDDLLWESGTPLHLFLLFHTNPSDQSGAGWQKIDCPPWDISFSNSTNKCNYIRRWEFRSIWLPLTSQFSLPCFAYGMRFSTHSERVRKSRWGQCPVVVRRVPLPRGWHNS